MFKKDDVVRFKIDPRNDLQVKKFGADARFVVELDQQPEGQTVRVRELNTQEKFRFYPWRLELVNVFAPGVIVTPTLGCPYASVVPGNQYEIQAVDGDRLKLKGISNKLKAEYFHFVRRPAAVPVAPVEKKEEPHEKRLKKLHEKVEGRAGVCSFYLLSKGSKEPKYIVRGPCHAQMRHGAYEEVGLNFSGHLEIVGNKDNYIRYLNYILKDSPFAPMFLDKDAKKAVETGVRLDVDKNRAWVYAAAIASRHYTEFSRKRETFNNVMDLGFDGNVAYIVSTFVDCRADGGITYNNFGGGHHVLDNSISVEDTCKTFAKGFWLNTQASTMREGMGNTEVTRSIATRNGTTFAQFFSDLFRKAEVKKDGWIDVKVLSGKNALNYVCIQVMKKLLEVK